MVMRHSGQGTFNGWKTCSSDWPKPSVMGLILELGCEPPTPMCCSPSELFDARNSDQALTTAQAVLA
jgi:hypothetical protein